MKIPTIALLLVLVAAASGCKESARSQAFRLKSEVTEIQLATLDVLLKNDLKFEIDLDEQDQFFASVRADVQRCRGIEAELRRISPGAELTQLEENTTKLLKDIERREQENQRHREHTRKLIEDYDLKKGANHAVQPDTGEAASLPESKTDDDGKLPTEGEERSR